jgi:PAS domain S-box-containing protein
MRYLRQIVIFLVLLVVCGFLLYSTYTDIEAKTIAQVNNEQVVHAGQAAAGIESFFTAYNGSLSFLAGNNHIINLDSDGRELMRNFFNSHAGEISSITRVDENGIITYTYPVESSTGVNISSQPHVRQLMDTRSVVISDVFASVQGFRTIAFHMPVYEDGRFKGSIAVLIPFDTLAEKNLGTIRILDSGYAWALSPNGVLLYSPGSGQIGNPVFLIYNHSPSVIAMAEEAIKGSSGVSSYTVSEDTGSDVPSRKFQAVYLPAKIGDKSWSVIVSTPENEILSTIQGFRNTLVVIFAILIISLLFFTYYVTRARGIVKEEEIRSKAEETLRESEEFNRSLVENLPDIILIYDAHGIIRFTNRAASDILSSPGSKIIGEPILSIIADHQRSDVETKMKARLSGARLPPYEVEIRTGNGEIITAILQAVPISYWKEPVVLVLMTNITGRKQVEAALQQVTKKLTLLNQVTFNDIQNAVFTLKGYLTLESSLPVSEPAKKYLEMEEESVRKIDYSLNFAKNYQDLGVKPPEWQNVHQSFLLGISHLDFSSVNRTIHLDNLEIYADSLLERVFFTLAGNVLRHAKHATGVTIGYQIAGDGLLLFFEDNGTGVPDANKEKIFERGYGSQQGMELFLVREILGITGITIHETGTYGSGARFEMNVPKGAYRFNPG